MSSKLQNWADTPFKLIPTPQDGPAGKEHASIYMAREMTHLHNMILRSLNSIYQQAPYVVNEQDIQDFLQFVKLWHGFLEHHHDTEEKVFFPGVEKVTGKTGIMDSNIEQHQAFEPGLIAIGKYAADTSPKNYDPEHLRSIIDSFGPVLVEHLNDEIDTLKGLGEYPSAPLMKAWNKSGDYAKSSGDPKATIPFMSGSLDFTYEGKTVTDLNMPFFMYYLNDFYFSKKYKGSWRFLPCNSRGIPQPLAFLPKAG